MSDVKGKTGAVLRETAVLTGAVAIIAAGVFFFLVPSHTSVSSISGLGIVLSNFVPLPLSVITMILNVVLLIIGFFTCGREFGAKTVVLSILGTYFNGIVLDHFIFDNSIKRRVCIITEKEEALRQFILHDLHSGATMYEAIGAYNLEKHNEIITIVDKSEYQKLMNFINREDPKAFVTVYNVSSMQYQPKI